MLLQSFPENRFARGLAEELRKEQRIGAHFMSKLKDKFLAAKRGAGLAQRVQALRKAHALQTAQANKLRAGAKEGKMYRETIRNQERTIGRLEKVLRKAILDPLPGGEDDPNREPEVEGTAEEQRQVDRLSGELKLKTDEPGEWVKQEEARLKKLVDATASAGAGAAGDAGPRGETFAAAWREDVSALDRRIAMLQEQMVSNARAFSGQMASYKTKLMELEMGFGGGGGGGDGF